MIKPQGLTSSLGAGAYQGDEHAEGRIILETFGREKVGLSDELDRKSKAEGRLTTARQVEVVS